MSLGMFGLTKNGVSASDLTVTAPTGPAGVICTPVASLAGMQALLLYLSLSYGSGGQSIKAFAQSSFDGNTWWDIACITFAMASKSVLLNFSALTPKLVQVPLTDGTMADDTAVDGLLCDRVRLKAVSLGTYGGNTVLSGRIFAR